MLFYHLILFSVLMFVFSAGCYISKLSYVRAGEKSLDSYYRPFHMVEYYRYVRFFPDGKSSLSEEGMMGTVLELTSLAGCLSCSWLAKRIGVHLNFQHSADSSIGTWFYVLVKNCMNYALNSVVYPLNFMNSVHICKSWTATFNSFLNCSCMCCHSFYNSSYIYVVSMNMFMSSLCVHP